ncbi:extracellular dioxygenase-like protein [Lentithecium fluviatile CBS 122367]|uniref:Extracellular dioxygenase-like protein n=1 Tax=Lentithecium fluviatile CBS 122367 TaxID=1168545 RepID=A0A6G1IWH1_9PLEO|nr:extracellular dioxygenase-like protein [Lentithecium fluviatile CBS 122367]
MVFINKALALLAASLLPSVILAHPGHDVVAEAAERAAALGKIEYRSLSHCAETLKKRGIEQRSIARRQATMDSLRKKRSLKARDFKTVLATDHQSTEKYNAQTPADILFSGNNSCILTPEVTEGPYYVTGELIRQNVVEEEPGVPLTYEVQVIDINTCEPIVGVMLEQWHCNSTGVYGGIAAGSSGGVSDPRELNNTMLRGIQPSKDEGVVLFDTIFPGHYTGRTPHIHVLAHLNASVLPNNTLAINTGTISHVGQLFFDQSLISLVETTAPYSTNTQQLTTNANDGIMAQEAATTDPVLHYALLGDTIEDGLFGWIAFGIDSKINKTVSAAANYGENGGQANPGGGMPGGPGGPPPGFPTSTAAV